jgi:large conductance mechanosensitive channel
MGFVKEFKEFAVRGNVVDLGRGCYYRRGFWQDSHLFGKSDVIMPPIGYLTGGVDFADKKIILTPADATAKTTR